MGYLKSLHSKEVAFLYSCRNRGELVLEIDADIEEIVDLAPPPQIYVPPTRPEPPVQKTHVCAQCGNLEWSGPATLVVDPKGKEITTLEVVLTEDFNISVTASFIGNVSSIRWVSDSGAQVEGDTLSLTRKDMEDGKLYQMHPEADDEDGHTIMCTLQIIGKLPPLSPTVTFVPPSPEKPHHKFPIPCIPREKNLYGIGWSMGGCAALAVGGYEVYSHLSTARAVIELAKDPGKPGGARPAIVVGKAAAKFFSK